MDTQIPKRRTTRSWWVLAGFVVLSAVLALVISWRQDVKSVASLSISVNRIHKQETLDYQYDGYYAIQASDLFSQTILSWFLTPSMILEMYQKAGVDPHIASLSELAGRFKARKYSAQNIVVQFSDPNAESAKKLAEAIGVVVKERGELLNKNEDNLPLFEVMPATPVVVDVRPNLLLNTLAAAVAALLLGFAVMTAKHYWKTGA